MILVDANVLLYAVNESEPRNNEARRWLDGALNDTETIGFAWVVLLAFLRISTRVGLFPRPLTTDEALDRTNSWLARAPAVVAEPTARHLGILGDLLRATATGGNLVADAHLAALALEHRASVVSYDSDFGRFPGVSWRRPTGE
ncbi:MAG: PIN domain-containing protein [Acidimicrobiaceae bacterium]|nr:PIN domain-containing protein [Acidimicrobiaceae bacterium]